MTNHKRNTIKQLRYCFIYTQHVASSLRPAASTLVIPKIFKLQDRALRIISFSDFRSDPNPIYRNFKILNLHDQIILQNVLFTHDALKNAAPTCFNEYFTQTRETHSHNTRNSTLGCLALSHSGTIRYGILSITSQCISDWNDISKSLQLDLLTLSRYELKSKLTKHLREQ